MLEAVQSVHAKIDKVVDGGISPNNIFVCGFSQGGFSLSLLPSIFALDLYIKLLYDSFFLLLLTPCRCLDIG